MNKDKALEELFLAQKPQFDDSEAFIESLNKRLDAVEYIKQHQEAAIRRYKMALVAAFVVGIISGAGVSITYMYAFLLDGRGILVFRTDQVEAAEAAISGHGLRSLSENDLPVNA